MSLDPEPILTEYLMPRDDKCHGSEPPLMTRVWYEPIEDEL